MSLDKVTAPEVLLEVRDLRREYQSGNRCLTILKDLNLNINANELIFITGRSGSGKSTLLNLLASLDSPTAGQILFRGKDLTKMSEKSLARYRATQIGFVFQFYYLLPELTALENVLLAAKISGIKKGRNRALDLLEKVGLKDRLSHRPGQLSGGEMQRVAIARALVNNPDLVFCDEPTGNLDEHTAGEIMKLLLSIRKEEGKSFCIVTHDENLVRHGQRVYYLNGGRLVSPPA